MEQKPMIAACGNDCSACPRHLPKSDEELHDTATLWFKIGYRSCIQSRDEIECSGCRKDNWCRYDIVRCTSEKGLNNCGECDAYPCRAIIGAFDATNSFHPKCVEACTRDELSVMEKAFFEKKKNLDAIRSN